MCIFVCHSFDDDMYDQWSKVLFDNYYANLKTLRDEEANEEPEYTDKILKLLDRLEYDIIKLKLNVLEAQYELLPGVPTMLKKSEERTAKEQKHKEYFCTEFSVEEDI